MKKILFFLCASLLIAGVAHATIGVKDTNSGLIYQATDVEIGSGLTISTYDGSTLKIAGTNTGAAAAITSGTIAGISSFTPAASSTTTWGATTTITIPSTSTVTLLGGALTASGTDLYWAGKKLSN